MNRALVVSVGKDNYNHFLYWGYARALKRWGWLVDWRDYADPLTDVTAFDLIIYSGAVPETILQRLSSAQVLILLGGAGDDLTYYSRYPSKIALATSSYFYLDDPGALFALDGISRWSMDPRTLYSLAREQHRYRKNASPRFWRRLGVPFAYVPFASDYELFYPLSGCRRDYKWTFCGSVKQRSFIRALIGVSEKRGWKYMVHSPETNNTIRPEELNNLYNGALVCPNQSAFGVFFRELNQRVWDVGMAGCVQVTDNRWLAEPLIGPFARYYAGKRANGDDEKYGLELVAAAATLDPDEVHQFFRERHSFEARLLQMGHAIAQDLSLGRSKSGEGARQWMSPPAAD